MNTTVNTPDLEKTKKDYALRLSHVKRRIVLCAGTGCVANGALKVRDELIKELKAIGSNVTVELEKEKEAAHDMTYVSKSGFLAYWPMAPSALNDPKEIKKTR